MGGKRTLAQLRQGCFGLVFRRGVTVVGYKLDSLFHSIVGELKIIAHGDQTISRVIRGEKRQTVASKRFEESPRALAWPLAHGAAGNDGSPRRSR